MMVLLNATTLLKVLTTPQGNRTIQESQVDHSQGAGGDGAMNLLEAPYPRDNRGRMTVNPENVDVSRYSLREAATGRLSTANFPDLLRAGLKVDLFSGFAEKPSVYPRLTRSVPSNEPFEEYADDTGMGIPPVVGEGEPYPMATPRLLGGRRIINEKRGVLVEITEELMKFDRVGKVRNLSLELGRGFRVGRDVSVMNVLTTAANYNSTLNLNDQNISNQQNWTFSPSNLNKALAMMATQKDRGSGMYLGVSPNVLVVGPLLERFARMLLFSPELMRVGGNTTNDVYGGGQNNPFLGAITDVIVSPLFSASYDWAILDSNRAIVFQEVEGLNIVNEGPTITSESWLIRDVIRYKARDWYGTGMRDDRFAFLSLSSTPPIAD